jgi:hypothetical protein
MFVESLEAGSVFGVGDGQIVRMNDQELRVARIAQPFSNGLGLREGSGQRRNQKKKGDSTLA